LGVAGLLECFVPTPDRRTRLPYHVGLGILLRSILTEREPLYRLGEVVETFAPEGFGLTEEQAHGLADDAMGRALDHLFDEDRGSRFVTVMPRSRLEDNELRAWIQDHEPEWERVWDRENPRRKGGPRDRWFVWKHHLPSREGWPVIWVFSHLLRHKQGQSRRERIARAVQELSDLAHHHLYGRPRNRARTEVWNQVTSILEAHKRQPVIESRFKQTKTVHEIAPVLLKNEGRIEALFFLYFVALLVSALLERDLHRAMAREEIGELPLYPEERKTPRPTAEQVLRLFSPAQRHRLYREGKEVEVFSPTLTDLQTQVLTLLGVPQSVYR